MHLSRKLLATLGAAGFLLAGCAQQGGTQNAADDGGQLQPETAAAVEMAAPEVVDAEDNGDLMDTIAGRKATDLNADWGRLDRQVDEIQSRMSAIDVRNQEASDKYHALMGQMTSRLQRGTTPGNPVLLSQWNHASVLLNNIEGNTSEMLRLSSLATNAATLGRYLMNSVQAIYGLSGAVEDDHALLRELEGRLYQTMSRIDRLMTVLSESINRQNSYVGNERRNLTTMSLGIENGELYGANLTSRAYAQTENMARRAAQTAVLQPGDRPLMVVRFNDTNIEYQQPMYNAVSEAITRKPGAIFLLEAVSAPSNSTAQAAMNSTLARQRAQEVLRTLMDMGVPGSRVQMLSSYDPGISANEVRLYVR